MRAAELSVLPGERALPPGPRPPCSRSIDPGGAQLPEQRLWATDTEAELRIRLAPVQPIPTANTSNCLYQVLSDKHLSADIVLAVISTKRTSVSETITAAPASVSNHACNFLCV